jgi:hypothetical protein
VVAAAPWVLVVLAPVSEGATQPSLAARASSSLSQPDYPPLLVIPMDSQGALGGLTSSTSSMFSAPGSRVLATAGPAAPPPQWLLNAQLRKPASAVGAVPLVSPAVLDSLKATGIPRVALAAYISAATAQNRLSPACGLSWPILAGIGYIESGHARSGGSAKANWSGIANPPIYGPLLDGRNGIALIRDTDHGALDGDAAFDRAVGPMQFLPSTWREYEEGASGHAAPDPQDVNDATLTAGRYLCATGRDLRTADGLIAAVYGYNHSFDYVTAVLSVAIRYGGGKLPGGPSALAELPALAKTAALLETAANMPTPTATPLQMPHPIPTWATSGSPSATQPPPDQYAPVPTYSPEPTAAPSIPPSSSSGSPTGDPSPTASPDPSASPSPTDTALPSPAPESSLPASTSTPPPTSSGATPSPTVGTP